MERLKCDKSYKISNVCVKAFAGKKYFSTLEATDVVEIDDIGSVCEANVAPLGDNTEFFVGEIIGIQSCTMFHSCLSCKGKVEE